jgi:hypothetical protein
MRVGLGSARWAVQSVLLDLHLDLADVALDVFLLPGAMMADVRSVLSG